MALAELLQELEIRSGTRGGHVHVVPITPSAALRRRTPIATQAADDRRTPHSVVSTEPLPLATGFVSRGSTRLPIATGALGKTKGS